jgi:hypothetical protein
VQVEKDEGYIRAVMALSGAAERIVKENNAIDIYEEYWEGARPENLNPSTQVGGSSSNGQPHPTHLCRV